MSQIEKLIEKLCRRPVPNDITHAEIAKLARHYGCIVDKKGGKHPLRIVHRESGTIIPIPIHGKHVAEGYIVQIKQLFDLIEGRW